MVIMFPLNHLKGLFCFVPCGALYGDRREGPGFRSARRVLQRNDAIRATAVFGRGPVGHCFRGRQIKTTAPALKRRALANGD